MTLLIPVNNVIVSWLTEEETELCLLIGKVVISEVIISEVIICIVVVSKFWLFSLTVKFWMSCFVGKVRKWIKQCWRPRKVNDSVLKHITFVTKSNSTQHERERQAGSQTNREVSRQTGRQVDRLINKWYIHR